MFKPTVQHPYSKHLTIQGGNFFCFKEKGYIINNDLAMSFVLKTQSKKIIGQKSLSLCTKPILSGEREPEKNCCKSIH